MGHFCTFWIQRNLLISKNYFFLNLLIIAPGYLITVCPKKKKKAVEESFHLSQWKKNHSNRDEAKWDVLTVTSCLWHVWKRCRLQHPLSLRCQGWMLRSSLIHSGEASEILSCCAYCRAKNAEPHSGRLSMLFFALWKISGGTEMTHRFTAKQNKIKHFYVFSWDNLAWNENRFFYPKILDSLQGKKKTKKQVIYIFF